MVADSHSWEDCDDRKNCSSRRRRADRSRRSPRTRSRRITYTYRCTGKDGKKYYGQTLPQACLGRPIELLNNRAWW